MISFKLSPFEISRFFLPLLKLLGLIINFMYGDLGVSEHFPRIESHMHETGLADDNLKMQNTNFTTENSTRSVFKL